MRWTSFCVKSRKLICITIIHFALLVEKWYWIFFIKYSIPLIIYVKYYLKTTLNVCVFLYKWVLCKCISETIRDRGLSYKKKLISILIFTYVKIKMYLLMQRFIRIITEVSLCFFSYLSWFSSYFKRHLSKDTLYILNVYNIKQLADWTVKKLI